MMAEQIDYNKRAHDWIIAKAEATIADNPLPVFVPGNAYRFDHEPKATFTYAGSITLTNVWGNLTQHQFVRQDGQMLTMTKYGKAPEPIN